MYEDHPTFIQPEDEEIRVWRYMDFTKLVSLINSRKLYFARADKLGDPFEGSVPKKNVAARGFVPEEVLPKHREQFRKNILALSNNNVHLRRYYAVNCWHINEHESAAMWGLYLKSNDGIAIQSTYAKLKKSLIDDERIFLGKVNYIDYDTGHIDPRSGFSPFLHKRMSFEYEQEVRAIVNKYPVRNGIWDFTIETIEHGLELSVDIETLIERIYVAPSAPGWFADLVNAVISKYGYEFEVAHSKLNEDPVF